MSSIAPLLGCLFLKKRVTNRLHHPVAVLHCICTATNIHRHANGGSTDRVARVAWAISTLCIMLTRVATGNLASRLRSIGRQGRLSEGGVREYSRGSCFSRHPEEKIETHEHLPTYRVSGALAAVENADPHCGR